LATKSLINQTVAKSALQRMVTSVFQRMEAASLDDHNKSDVAMDANQDNCHATETVPSNKTRETTVLALTNMASI
jgi:hypothetical protein